MNENKSFNFEILFIGETDKFYIVLFKYAGVNSAEILENIEKIIEKIDSQFKTNYLEEYKNGFFSGRVRFTTISDLGEHITLFCINKRN